MADMYGRTLSSDTTIMPIYKHGDAMKQAVQSDFTVALSQLGERIEEAEKLTTMLTARLSAFLPEEENVPPKDDIEKADRRQTTPAILLELRGKCDRLQTANERLTYLLNALVV